MRKTDCFAEVNVLRVLHPCWLPPDSGMYVPECRERLVQLAISASYSILRRVPKMWMLGGS